jgi:glycosyltransferase involved in cell wall biosynthesis
VPAGGGAGGSEPAYSADSVGSAECGGAGPARNAAVRASSGAWLCFLDADDYMATDRVALQLAAAVRHTEAIVGCGFTRLPEGSTPRYTKWCNSLTHTQLLAHRFRELTVVQPTWFMARATYDRVGGYPASTAEDLHFFYKHIELWLARHQPHRHQPPTPTHPTARDHVGTPGSAGGSANAHANANAPTDDILLRQHSAGRDPDSGTALVRLEAPLVTYRYRGDASVSASTPKDLIRRIRITALERQVLGHGQWAKGFGIWGAGKYGKAFYRGLSSESQRRVTAFYDVDKSKHGVYNDHGPNRKALVRQVGPAPSHFCSPHLAPSNTTVCQHSFRLQAVLRTRHHPPATLARRQIPVLAVSEVRPPFISCVSLDRTDGDFEANLAEATRTLDLVEARDYFLFG